MSKARANKTRPQRRERRRWVPRAHRRRNAFKSCPDCGKPLAKQNARSLGAHRVHCPEYQQRRARLDRTMVHLLLGVATVLFAPFLSEESRLKVEEAYCAFVRPHFVDDKAQSEVKELEDIYNK